MSAKKVLVVDVGGSNVKILATDQEKRRKSPSGSEFTPKAMVKVVRRLAADWDWDVVTVGIPAPVLDGRPIASPPNLGTGWDSFDYEGAFGKPTMVCNDASMQALGSYEGGRMLFLGLGTGLGAALVYDGVVIPLEIAHLPFGKGTYEDALGDRGYDRLGRSRWNEVVAEVTKLFRDAFVVDYVMLGGGNVKKIAELPPNCRRGGNANAFKGGFMLWHTPEERAAEAVPH